MRVDRIATDTSRPTGTWNTSCYSTVCALSDGQISGACLSVCLSVASCEAHRWAGRWLPTHRSELVLSLQGHLPGETKDRAWNPALIRQAQEQVSEYMGPQISGPSWCGVATHAETQDLQAAAGKQRYPTPGPQGCGQPPHREPLSRGSLPAALFLPFPHIPRTWTAFTENSGLGEETPEAPGRVPAGKPIHPSEDTLPTCGQNSSPRGAAVCPKQAPLLE